MDIVLLWEGLRPLKLKRLRVFIHPREFLQEV